jgi:hypothetical protein
MEAPRMAGAEEANPATWGRRGGATSGEVTAGGEEGAPGGAGLSPHHPTGSFSPLQAPSPPHTAGPRTLLPPSFLPWPVPPPVPAPAWPALQLFYLAPGPLGPALLPLHTLSPRPQPVYLPARPVAPPNFYNRQEPVLHIRRGGGGLQRGGGAGRMVGREAGPLLPPGEAGGHRGGAAPSAPSGRARFLCSGHPGSFHRLCNS